MSSKEELVGEIVEGELTMFQSVPNVGGKALCQEDPKTFRIMRSSQFMSWSDEILESYLDDLREAIKVGRNLLTEKYAHMMESTSPSEYRKIRHMLPKLDPAVPSLIESIVDMMLGWEYEVAQKYPHIISRGRPLRRSDERPFVASVETYLRGELATYSQKTLRLYRDHLLELKSSNRNASELILANMVKQYGYVSLEDADQRIGEKVDNR
ncbi:MAG: DUF4125 family protein [Chloroflexota bacterium]|nr:DUF4125 family protein [Chloroflexota bacterium]